ncbi:MAG TPA: SBBP repeat-containing protein, partial [Bacteroidia bacterium]
MKKSLFLLLILIHSYSYCQQLNWISEDSLYDNGYHFGNCVSIDADNNIYTSTIFRPDQSGHSLWGTFISKRDEEGNLLWRKFIGRSEVWGLTTDNFGNSYMTGVFCYYADFGCGILSDSTQIRTFFLAKLDPTGNCLWSKMVTTAVGSKIAINRADNSIYVIGQYNVPAQFDSIVLSGPRGQFLAKYDSSGNAKWVKPILNYSYICNVSANDNYVAITGNYAYAAYFSIDSTGLMLGNPTSGGIHNIYTALYDPNGNLKWAKQSVAANYDVKSNSISLDSDNNVYVIGSFYNTATIGGKFYSIDEWQDIFVIKYNEYGDTLMTSTFPGKTVEEGRAIHANENGVYYSGVCYGQLTVGDTTINPGKPSVFLAKLDHDLKHTQWIKTYNSPTESHSEIFQITSDNNGNIIACGDYTTSLQVDNVFLNYNNGAYKKPFVLS